MTETEALEALTLRLQPTVAPLLDAAQMTSLAKIAVSHGLKVALYTGWDVKAAKALSEHDISAGENRLYLSQVYRHCVMQRDSFAPGGGGRGLRTASTYRGL